MSNSFFGIFYFPKNNSGQRWVILFTWPPMFRYSTWNTFHVNTKFKKILKILIFFIFRAFIGLISIFLKLQISCRKHGYNNKINTFCQHIFAAKKILTKPEQKLKNSIENSLFNFFWLQKNTKITPNFKRFSTCTEKTNRRLLWFS